MSGKTITALVVGAAAGFVFGYLLNRPMAGDNVSVIPETASNAATNAVGPIETNSKTREQQLLLMAIQELDLTSSELEGARAEIQRMERKAQRYDWLRDNGLHGNHSMSFEKNTFKPSDKLIDFLGLNEEDADEMTRISEQALVSARNWEEENAVCLTDSATNCVYEVGPLPETFKQDFIARLGNLLHAEDIQLLEQSIDKVYEDSTLKRQVSATFIPAEVYAEQMKQHGHKHYSKSDMMRIKVQKFRENGAKSGSSSSSFGFSNRSQLKKNSSLQRWNHLFDVESFMPES